MFTVRQGTNTLPLLARIVSGVPTRYWEGAPFRWCIDNYGLYYKRGNICTFDALGVCMDDRVRNIRSTKNPNLALMHENHNLLWKTGFCTVAIIFLQSKKGLRMVMTHCAAIGF